MNVMSNGLLVLTMAISATCGPAPEMPVYKSASVELLDNQEEKNFYLLPLKASVQYQQKLWSGDYWPLNQGLINFRWNSDLQESFDYYSPSPEEVATMLPEELAQLSPAEKFDLYLGRYDYPLKEEVDSHANRFAKDWEGICNGWAPASLNHNEPLPKTVINPQGIEIPFGSSDIKALLSYYYAFIHKIQDTQQMGRRCPSGRWFNWNQDCHNDLNAGSFHVVMANKVGLKNQSFLVDIDRFKEVWNHPLVGYVSRVEGELPVDAKSPPGSVKVLKVRTKVSYVDGSQYNSWAPVRGTPLQSVVVKEYSYNLFLNLNNEIIDGAWTSQDRPDFLWIMGASKKFLGLLEELGPLLND
jgi:hypothetical protein